MIIVIDQDLDAQGNVMARHVADTNDPVFIAEVTARNANPATHTDHSWNIVSQQSGELAPLSRWQRLLAIVNSANGPANLKALNLH